MDDTQDQLGDGWKSCHDEGSSYICRKCRSLDVWYRIFESSCGGFADEKYICRTCKAEWWIDGVDA
jgi:hypothetical protein